MSVHSRGNLQRGASVIAALVFVIVLGAIAVALQNVTQPVVIPESQSAQSVSAQGDTRCAGKLETTNGVTRCITTQPTTVKIVCKPGEDYNTTVSLNSQSGMSQLKPEVFKICPPEWTSDSKPADTTRVWCARDGVGPATESHGLCRYDKVGNKYILQKWECRERIMNDKAVAPDKKCTIQKTTPGQGVGTNIQPKDPKIETLAKEVAEGKVTPEQLKGMNLDAAQQAQLKSAFEAQSQELKEQKAAEERDAATAIAALGACQQKQENVWQSGACQTERTAADAAQEKLKLTTAQLNNLANAKVALTPETRCNNPNGCGSTTPSPGTPGTNPPPSGPGPGTTLGPPGGMSPMGGGCQNQYVCQGNTLYYQTMGYTGQCSMQPVQQCQYGCQQLGGAGGGSMSNISQGIGIFSSVMRLFGGGSGASSMPSMPTSNSCATQPQNQNGTGTDGRACERPPQQPPANQCTSGGWKPVSSTGNGCVTGYQCVPNADGIGAPTAQLSCQPKIADVGMTIGFSFSCGGATESVGGGFSTGGALSGTSSTTIQTPPAGVTKAIYTLTCAKPGATTSAQCQVDIGKPAIIMVATPKKVASGEIATIGWITTGMDACVVSSPDQNDFTTRNASNTSVNGAATTSPITASTVFELTCDTVGGEEKSASTTVTIL